MRHVNWMVAVALASFGITAMVAAWSLEFWPDRFGPGEGFLPVVLGVVLAVLCLGIAIFDWRNKDADDADVAEALNLSKPVRATISFVVYIICFGFLGFIVSTVIFMIIYLLWVEARSLRLAVGVSLSVTVVTYIIFIEFLGVDLPFGVFEGVRESIS
jgi:putative tricarboxylic transport membrane protein